MFSTLKKTTSKSIPCTFISKSSTTLKSIVKKTNTVAPTTQHIPITIPAKLTTAQKEEALPFLTQEPEKSKSSKAKNFGRLFKKIAKKTASQTEKTQFKLTFIPIIKNQKVAVAGDSTPTAAEYAQRIWNEDKSVYNLEKVVEWIGSDNESSKSILQAYMTHFDFTDLKLEQAFRNLCSKLYLKGETQQIDRVLYEFSARYFECNTDSIFGSIDVVHAITYSLLLLNTDLHVATGGYKRMSQSEFIKNTMNAISSGTPAMMRSSFDVTSLQGTSTVSSCRSSIYARSIESIFSTSSNGVKAWDVEIKHLLKQMYMNIRTSQITNPATPPASISKNSNCLKSAIKRVGTLTKRKAIIDDASSIVSSTRSSIVQYEAVASHLQHSELPLSYTSTAPYYKEGIVTRKHLLQSKDQKAKHRDWKECFMVIDRNQLNMYKLESSHITQTASIGGGDWIAHAQVIGSVDLKHTLASVLPSGYNSRHQHAFTLEQPNGAKYVFQAGSADQVLEWVSTCNYWAARESKEPLTQGISSMEYGWGKCLDTASSVMIHDWQSPSAPVISSKLEEPTQLKVLHKHVEELTNQLDQHRDVKEKMETRFFASSKLSNKVKGNWENKSHYLLHEIIKYQNYCTSIEKSLSLQASAMA